MAITQKSSGVNGVQPEKWRRKRGSTGKVAALTRPSTRHIAAVSVFLQKNGVNGVQPERY